MKTLLKEQEANGKNICLYEIDGKASTKFGISRYWEVRTYPKRTTLNYLVHWLIEGDLEGIRTSKEDAEKLFDATCKKADCKVVPIKREVQNETNL